jgi:hypothetical protein
VLLFLCCLYDLVATDLTIEMERLNAFFTSTVNNLEYKAPENTEEADLNAEALDSFMANTEYQLRYLVPQCDKFQLDAETVNDLLVEALK